MVFYNRRFNPYDVERVVERSDRSGARHRLTEVALVDSNFLVDVHRAVAIARGFLESGVRFQWTFQASTDLLCRMTDEEVDAARRKRREPHRIRHGVGVARSAASR